MKKQLITAGFVSLMGCVDNGPEDLSGEVFARVDMALNRMEAVVDAPNAAFVDTSKKIVNLDVPTSMIGSPNSNDVVQCGIDDVSKACTVALMKDGAFVDKVTFRLGSGVDSRSKVNVVSELYGDGVGQVQVANVGVKCVVVLDGESQSYALDQCQPFFQAGRKRLDAMFVDLNL